MGNKSYKLYLELEICKTDICVQTLLGATELLFWTRRTTAASISSKPETCNFNSTGSNQM